jgi:hypothetical protein
MKKLALIIASSVFAVSLVGTGAAFAQTTPAPAQPDATTAAPAAPSAPMHKKAKHHKAAAHKHKAKAAKKTAPKAPAEQPMNDDSTQQPAQ